MSKLHALGHQQEQCQTCKFTSLEPTIPALPHTQHYYSTVYPKEQRYMKEDIKCSA